MGAASKRTPGLKEPASRPLTNGQQPGAAHTRPPARVQQTAHTCSDLPAPHSTSPKTPKRESPAEKFGFGNKLLTEMRSCSQVPTRTTYYSGQPSPKAKPKNKPSLFKGQARLHGAILAPGFRLRFRFSRNFRARLLRWTSRLEVDGFLWMPMSLQGSCN